MCMERYKCMNTNLYACKCPTLQCFMCGIKAHVECIINKSAEFFKHVHNARKEFMYTEIYFPLYLIPTYFFTKHKHRIRIKRMCFKLNIN